MSRYTLLLLNGAILTSCAVFIYDQRTFVLTGLMLFLPFLDRHWHIPLQKITPKQLSIWLAIVMPGLVIIIFHINYAASALLALWITALPEEWFFRAYMLTGVEKLIREKLNNLSPQRTRLISNILVSIFFTLIHIPIQGWYGLMVLLPSLVFGWLYQAYRDIVMVILLHALSNLIFIIYIRDVLWQKAIY